ncbi:minor capsid protein [Clostridium sp. HBUAS56017]|jgi:hypothetical protein|uniref:minor capsid protein n=1 Tax=Clostridium sp. HBUAS56017 TaxID=2571128 RepID=UPI0011781EF8|nr:minor capsid protein [Clostridium sp. HBUAS56017]
MKVTISFNSTEKILLKRNLQKGGKVQQFFTNEVARQSNPYIPFDNGGLKDKQVQILPDKIKYNAPYARYQYYGKVMVGNAPKKVTDKDLSYHGAPKRGKMWDKRMWADRGKEIVRSVASFAGGRVK